ncbi:MAG: hypothetical protein M1434_13105 [Chloroflexi bacterium]|nr:hypothetical protein [Chloroflexota bacterium]MCL5275660.1 hypothetical protein [Chloroflexota bacterium]
MVHEQSLNTGDTPEVVIEQANGDLRLMGWERPEVLAKVEGELSLRQNDDKIVRLRCGGDAVVRVPAGASLIVEQSQGDLRIKSVNGRVKVGNSAGDLSLRHLGEVQVGAASGDASLKHIAGTLNIDNVNGELSLLDVNGAVSIGNVSGDLSLRAVNGDLGVDSAGGDLFVEGVKGKVFIGNIAGDLRAAGVQGEFKLGNVAGDASTSGAPGPIMVEKVSGDLNAQGVLGIQAVVSGDATLSFASTHVPSNVTASGDIVCRFTPDASATVRITSASNNITVNTPSGGRSIEEGSYELKLGGGETAITLNASGDATVLSNATAGETSQGKPHPEFDFDFDFDRDFGAFGSSWGAFGERIAQRAREAAERATANVQAKVQAKVAQATRRAEEQARRAETQARRAERRAQGMMGRRMNFGSAGGWRVERPPAPPPPEPPREPVSDEERMTILRMLEQKKITAAQAEQLLTALSGKGA